MQYFHKLFDHRVLQNTLLKILVKKNCTVRRNNSYREVVNLFYFLFQRENQVANFRFNIRKMKAILMIVFKKAE